MLRVFGRSRGGVFAEFAVVLPLFLLLIMGLYDTTRALNHYFLLARIAYESTRLATGVVGLEEGTFTDSNVVANSVHQALQTKIRSLIATYDTRVPSSAISITSSFIGSSNTVEITIRESYHPMFMQVFPTIPISSTVKGPYLLQSTVLPTPTAPPVATTGGVVGVGPVSE